jgi:hypothetical protein
MLNASVAQSGTAQAWKLILVYHTACFRKDIPVQIRALALYFCFTPDKVFYN